MPEWLRWGRTGAAEASCRISLLSQSVYDPDPAVRAFAAGALGEFGTPDCAAPLTHAIGDDDPRVRSIAAAGLGRLQLSHTKPLLWTAAKDPVALVRAGAVEGLLRLGDAEAVLVARELSQHPDPSIRSAVAQAIGQSRYKGGVPLLDLRPASKSTTATAPHRRARARQNGTAYGDARVKDSPSGFRSGGTGDCSGQPHASLAAE